MNFNNAIPLQLRPKFSEGSALASERDSRSNAQLWKKARTNSRQENSSVVAIQKASREIGKMRRRIVGASLPEKAVNFFHPFKLYNVPSEFCPPIDVPNNYNPVTDSWRTFRVRAGIVGFRSVSASYKPNGGNPYYTPGLSAPEYYISAAHPIGDAGLFGTDGSSRYRADATSEFFPYDEDTFDIQNNTVVYLDNVGDFNAGDSNGTFVIKGTPDENNSVMASFWIEVKDYVGLSGPTARIKCRMITAQSGDATGRENQFFPDASNNTIIPIGIVVPKVGYFAINIADGKDLYCEQILNESPVNRYSQGYAGSVGGSSGMVAYRGNWDSDSIGGQYFYPGDSTMAGNRMYVHNGYGTEASAPTGDGTPNWTWLNINGS